VQGPVSGFVAEASGFNHEKFGWVGFVDEEDCGEEDAELEDAGEVFGPAPAERGLDYEGSGGYGACFVIVRN
jgi:hypothetical protein